MAQSIEELRALLQPTADEKKNALKMGLLNFGAGILANNTGHYGRLAPALGAGIQRGLQGYQGALQGNRENRLQDVSWKMKLDEYQQQQEQAERMKQWQGSMPQPQTQVTGVSPELASGNFNMNTSPLSSITQTTQPTQEQYNDWIRRGMGVNPDVAYKQAQTLKSLAPDPIDWNKPILPNGQINEAYQKYEYGKARAGKPETNVYNMPPQKRFENEGKLRDDFRSEPVVKAAAEMNSAFGVIDAAFKRPSAANDLAMATKYMKVLDPTSVVRESEFALAVNATGLLDKVYNYAHAIATGERLNPTQRKDFYDSAKAINDAFQAEKENVAKSYKDLAKSYDLDQNKVIFQGKKGNVVDFGSLK